MHVTLDHCYDNHYNKISWNTWPHTMQLSCSKKTNYHHGSVLTCSRRMYMRQTEFWRFNSCREGPHPIILTPNLITPAVHAFMHVCGVISWWCVYTWYGMFLCTRLKMHRQPCTSTKVQRINGNSRYPAPKRVMNAYMYS